MVPEDGAGSSLKFRWSPLLGLCVLFENSLFETFKTDE